MSAKRTEETAVEKRTQTSAELAPIVDAQAVAAEIQAAITVAVGMKRNETAARDRLMESCKRSLFADKAQYAFKRGRKKDARGRFVDNIISGPSVHLAREAARLWGNIRSGFSPVTDDDEQRTIEAWAWDLETNTKVSASTTFRKLIKRGDSWIVPDERDLREMTNRHAAILKRNCILELIPPDIIDEARAQCEAALESETKANKKATVTKLIKAFAAINVTDEQLAAYLEHPLDKCSTEEVTTLRKIYRSIMDGNTSWKDYEKSSDKSDDEARDNGIGLEDLAPETKDEKPQPKAEPEPAAPRVGDPSTLSPEDRKKLFED